MRDHLDWLRVAAVLLLLPFHSARVFDPDEDFYIHAARTSEPLFWVVVGVVPVSGKLSLPLSARAV